MAVAPGGIAVIGFDAMDAAVVLQLARAGELPAFARLLEQGPPTPVENPPGLVVGGVWPTVVTGTLPDRHGRYCFRQLVGGTYAVATTTPELLAEPRIWEPLDAAGRRCCIIDVPLVGCSTLAHGVHVADWSTHDRPHHFATSPPDLAAELTARHGPMTTDRFCDRIAEEEGTGALFGVLTRAVPAKTRLALDLLARGEWDLFWVVYGESHCTGHQLWRHHDPSHPLHDPDAPEARGRALAACYRALDAGLGALLDALGPETTVLVHLSHGMGPHYDGTHLLPEILRRLDDAYGRAPAALRWREGALRRVERRRLPARLPPGFDRERRLLSVDSSRRFFPVPNNDLYGAVRFNVRGREPRGRVAPDDVDALAMRLARDLCALEESGTGRRVVREVWRTADRYRPGVTALPDLIIDWDRSGPIHAVTSPLVGTVHGVAHTPRSGDHRPPGALLAAGRAALVPGPVEAADIAATLAAHLRVDVPGLDGRCVLAQR